MVSRAINCSGFYRRRPMEAGPPPVMLIFKKFTENEWNLVTAGGSEYFYEREDGGCIWLRTDEGRTWHITGHNGHPYYSVKTEDTDTYTDHPPPAGWTHEPEPGESVP